MWRGKVIGRCGSHGVEFPVNQRQIRYRLDGLVTTIDLTSAEATLDAQPEAVKQAAMADCLLLTKRDLVEPEQAAVLEQRLLRINPAARRLEARHGQVAAADILGLGIVQC